MGEAFPGLRNVIYEPAEQMPLGFIAPGPGDMVTQDTVSYHNPVTGETWDAPSGGYTPPWGWVKGRPIPKEGLNGSQMEGTGAPGISGGPYSGEPEISGGIEGTTGTTGIFGGSPTGSTIGGIAGLASGIPGLGVVGAGLGTAYDVSQANTALEGVGASPLGFGDWASGLANAASFGMFGESIGDQAQESWDANIEGIEDSMRGSMVGQMALSDQMEDEQEAAAAAAAADAAEIEAEIESEDIDFGDDWGDDYDEDDYGDEGRDDDDDYDEDDDYADGGFVADEFETNGHFYMPHSGTNSTLSFDALGIPFDLDARQTSPTGIEALLTSPEYRNWSVAGGVEGTGDTTAYNLGVAFNFPNVPRFMEDILSRGKVTASVKGQLTPGADSLRSIAAEGQLTPELLNLAVKAGMGRTDSGRRDFNVGANLPVGAGSLGASYNRQLNPGAPDSSNFKADLSYPMFGGIINAYANRAKAEGSLDRDSMGAAYNKGNFSADVSTSPEETRAMLNYRRPF